MTQKNIQIPPLSDIEETILSVLSGRGELYGLQISKTIEAGSEGRLTIGFGTLYPALRRMETRDFVVSKWGDSSDEDRGGARRRYYKITALGEDVLRAKQALRCKIASQEPILGT